MSARITVLGAGYAGRLAATRLDRLGHDVTLVDRQAVRVQRVALHRLAATGARVTRPMSAVLRGTGVRFVRAEIAHLDGTSTVLADGRRLHAEHVVLATGSTSARAPYDGDPDDAPYAIGSLPEAERLHRALLAHERPRVAVVGSGLTGLELATEIAHHRDADVTLIGASLFGVGFSADALPRLRRRLDHLNIAVHEETRVRRAWATGLDTNKGRMDVDLVVWCGGLAPSPLVRALDLPRDPAGRALVDETLSARPGLSVVGDAAGLGDRPAFAMSCALALPMGAHVAAAVDARLADRPPPAFRFASVARCVQLGGGHALVQHTHPDGRPTRAWSGPFAALFKQSLYRYILDVPALERHTRRSWYTWPRGPRPTPQITRRTA